MSIAYDLLLDTIADECPLPTIKAKAALDSLQAGGILKVVIGKAEAARNLRTLTRGDFCELIHESRQDEHGHALYIRKR